MDPLSDISPLYIGIFLLFICFSIFALLNVVTSVFVDGALAKSQTERDLVVEKEMNQRKAMIHNLRDLFSEGDSDGSGHITFEEFEQHMKQRDFEAYLSALHLDTSDA